MTSHRERRARKRTGPESPPIVPPRGTRDPALGRPGIMFCPNGSCLKTLIDLGAESTRAERIFNCEDDDERGRGCGAQWQGWGWPRAVDRLEPGPVGQVIVEPTLDERAQRATGRVVRALARLGAEQLEAIADQLEKRGRLG